MTTGGKLLDKTQILFQWRKRCESKPASCLQSNSVIRIFLKRWAAPGRQAPGMLKPPGVGKYCAVQCDCNPIIPSVAPATKSFFVSCTSHMRTSLTHNVT